MDWKTRKDKLQADEAAEETPGISESFVAPASVSETRQRPSQETEDPSFFFDLNNDAFRTDSRRTAIDAYTAPDWVPDETVATPSINSDYTQEPSEQTSHEIQFPAFSTNGYEDVSVPQTHSQDFHDIAFPEDTSEEAFPKAVDLSWDEPKTSEPIALDAFAPYQPESNNGSNGFGSAADFTPTPPVPVQPIQNYFATPDSPKAPSASDAASAFEAFTPLPTVAPQPIESYFSSPAPTPAPPPVAAPQIPNPFVPQTPQPRPLIQGISPTQPKPKPDPPQEELHPDSGRERPRVPSGLVVTESDTGIPKVAPFIVPATHEAVDIAEAQTEHCLILRMRNLSATFVLTKPVTTMGRPDSLSQSYPDIEIELDDSVSRRHAEVRRHGNNYFLVDLGSTNGTMLNGQKLLPDVEMRLAHGDRLRVGERTEIIFE